MSTDFPAVSKMVGCSTQVTALKRHSFSLLDKVLEVHFNNESNYILLCGASTVEELCSSPSGKKSLLPLTGVACMASTRGKAYIAHAPNAGSTGNILLQVRRSAYLSQLQLKQGEACKRLQRLVPQENAGGRGAAVSCAPLPGFK